MLFAASLDILSDAGIERVVSAAQYVDKPIFYQFRHLLTQLPPGTVFTMDKLVRIGAVCGLHRLGIPC